MRDCFIEKSWPFHSAQRGSAAALCPGMDGDEVNQVVDGIVGEFQTYEDYLDSQISATDLYYLEDEDLARQ